MTKRKQRRALARWENDTRQRAHQTARDLVLAMASGQPTSATPYGIGVVLDPGEQVWAECPVRFHQEIVRANGPAIPPVRPWLVTSDRIVGRLGDDGLYGCRWEDVRGCRVDLCTVPEFVALDLDDCSRLDWTGPAVAPLAVAAVYRLHGDQALVDHPGLAEIRLGHGPEVTSQLTAAALPPWREAQNWFETLA